MKIAIIQPNFFPFKAYYDLAEKVDKFIFLDDTRYNNKSWINKTMINMNSKNYYFRIPLDHDPSSAVLTKDVKPKNRDWKNKFLRIIKAQYKRSPNFDVLYPIIKEIINIPADCFAHISAYSVFRLASSILETKTNFTFSSIQYGNVKLSYHEKIIYICKKEKAKTFYTFASNRGVYDERKFLTNGIAISYFKSYSNNYSFIDEIMYNHSYRDILEKECNLLQDERA